MPVSLALLLAGCAPLPPDVAVEVHDAPVTIATVRITTPTAARAWVEYGLTDDYGRSTPVSAEATEHTIPVLGLRADTTWHYRVVLDGVPGERGTFTTEPLPAPLPELQVSGETAVGEGYTLFSVQHGDPMRSAVYLVDAEGEVAWYHLSDGMVLSARLSRDGTAVWVQVTEPDAESENHDRSRIQRVPLDGGETTSFAVPFTHHDFFELPDGVLVAIVTAIEEVDGAFVAGDALVRATPDGALSKVWSAFDDLEVVENEGWSSEPADWTHANGIDYDDATGRIALSLFRQHQVLILDMDGVLDEVVGAGGDYDFVDDPGFGPQHGPRFIDGGLQVLDNAGDGVSRVVQYALDADAGTATPTWSYSHPFGYQVLVLGDALRLPDGNTLTAWGDTGELLVSSADGQVIRRIFVEAGVGRVSTVESLYPPG